MDPVESLARVSGKGAFGALYPAPFLRNRARWPRKGPLLLPTPDLRPHEYKLSTPLLMVTNSRYREPSTSNTVRRPSRLRGALWQVPHKTPGVQPGRP
jgi:hypothetical protein